MSIVISNQNKQVPKVYRVFLLLPLVSLYFYVGYLNTYHVFNFDNWSWEVNQGYNPNDYVIGEAAIIQESSSNPKWSSTVVVSLILMLLSSLIVGVVTWKKSMLLLLLAIYGIIGGLSAVVFVLGILMSESLITYDIVRFIKNHLLQSPLIMILGLIFYILDEKLNYFDQKSH